MKTNRLFLVALLAAFTSLGTLSAQPAQSGREKKQPTQEERIEWQVSRMEKELLLNESEAARFAPVYKEYLQAIQQCRPASCCKPGEKKERTDAEIEKSIQEGFTMQKKLAETQETYFNKLKGILNARQLEKVFRAERHPGFQHKPCKDGKRFGPQRGKGKPAPAPCCQEEPKKS